jgi:hypothetical protein
MATGHFRGGDFAEAGHGKKANSLIHRYPEATHQPIVKRLSA